MDSQSDVATEAREFEERDSGAVAAMLVVGVLGLIVGAFGMFLYVVLR